MLTQHHCPVCLSLTSFDLPIWSILETNATLYQKDGDRFHLLLTEPLVQDIQPFSQRIAAWEASVNGNLQTPRLLWLEISPYRVIMTMQGNGKFSYRHFWEQGVYGVSRYWLQSKTLARNEQIRLRNYTRSLFLRRNALPEHLRIEYELWSDQVQIGQYVMNLEIRH
ncbi:MAG: hypothetical protein HC772_08410 [Leptolyngbyaceae cyanobacterium CRU_2_3]|nr:hypothetical protein [Leptolyngbyaceae cyanobacterium CRU_2_3]